jgi:hypothetical protein
MANDSARQHLIGTWKLIAAVREEFPPHLPLILLEDF